MLPVPRAPEDALHPKPNALPPSISRDDVNSHRLLNGAIGTQKERSIISNLSANDSALHATFSPSETTSFRHASRAPATDGRPIFDVRFQRPLMPASATFSNKQPVAIPSKASMMTTFSTRIAPKASQLNSKAQSATDFGSPVGQASKIIFEASPFTSKGEASMSEPRNGVIPPWSSHLGKELPNSSFGPVSTALGGKSAIKSTVPQKPPEPCANTSETASMLDRQIGESDKGFGKGPPAIKRGPQSHKRKRDDDSDAKIIKAKDSPSSGSDSEEYNPQDTQTKSGRQVHRPTQFVPSESPQSTKQVRSDPKTKRKLVPASAKGRDQNILCEHCLRGNGPPGNVIVFCDGCNRAWHQNCHEPRIKKEVVVNTEKDWFCAECNSAAAHAPPKAKKVRPNKRPITESVHSSVGSHTAVSTQPVLLSGKDVKRGDQKKYLSSLSKDQLVEKLLQIASLNPGLPLFPKPQRTPPASDAPPTSLKNDPAPRGSASTPTTSAQQRKITPGKESPQDSDDEYIYDEHALLYPTAGHGIQLPPESEDLHMLLEGPDCKTFSHQLRAGVTPVSTGVKAGRSTVGVFG